VDAVYHINTNDAENLEWEAVPANPAVIVDGTSDCKVHWAIKPDKVPSRMSLLIVRDQAHAERTITISDSVIYVLKGEGRIEFEERPWLDLKPGVAVSISSRVKLVWRFYTPIELLSVYAPNWVPLRDKSVFEMDVGETI
jgi:hypothetical protein